MNDGTLQAELCRENGDKEPCIRRVEENLEERIEGDQSSGILCIAAGQFIPDNDHGDAASQANQDQPNHVFRVAAQKDYG